VSTWTASRRSGFAKRPNQACSTPAIAPMTCLSWLRQASCARPAKERSRPPACVRPMTISPVQCRIWQTGAISRCLYCARRGKRRSRSRRLLSSPRPGPAHQRWQAGNLHRPILIRAPDLAARRTASSPRIPSRHQKSSAWIARQPRHRRRRQPRLAAPQSMTPSKAMMLMPTRCTRTNQGRPSPASSFRMTTWSRSRHGSTMMWRSFTPLAPPSMSAR